MPKEGDPLTAGQIAMIRAWIDQGAAWPETGSRPPNPRQASRAGSGPLGLPSRRRSRPLPDVQEIGLGAHPDRSLRPRSTREGSAAAVARSAARNARAAGVARSDRPAAVAGRSGRGDRRGGRERSRCRVRSAWSIDCSRRRTTANGGRGRGSIWPATPTRTASRKTCPRVMWKYRDWVIDALNRDMPFDRFTVEQIAGDMLKDATRRAADRQRVPSQRDDQRRGRHRSGGGALRGAGRSGQHDVNGLARDARSAARSATTTSTTPSARRTTTG